MKFIDRPKICAKCIDTSTPGGRMMMQIVGSFAEFERAMLKERTRCGLDSARKEGRVGGRLPKLTQQQQQQKEIVALVNSSSLKILQPID
jgi:DNA invertase Pin-like site-specific DNA recombinase